METTRLHLPDYHRLRSTIPDHSATLLFSYSTPSQRTRQNALPQPHTRNTRRLSHAHGLAPSPFAHHYSGNHYCFLFLRVLRCFTSPRYHQPPYTFRWRQHPITGAGLPHSETPGSTLGCQLPGAYRRLPRPSSAPDAKASTVCPQKLEHNKKTEMLAFTMQFSKHERKPTHNHHQHPPANPRTKNQEPTKQKRYGGQDRPAHPRPHPPNPAEGTADGPTREKTEHPTSTTARRPFPQDPTV
jgi:hypothetical protein